MKVGISIFIIALLLLVPGITLAGEYTAGEEATLYAQVLDGAGDPVNDATVSLTLWDPDGNKELDGVSMSYVTGSQGIYGYDFTVPEDPGVYVADIISANPTGYGSTELHVTPEVSYNFTGANITVDADLDASSLWGVNMSDYDDPATFGGFFNITLGGSNMSLIQILFIVALLAIAIWQKGWLRVIPAIAIITWGAASIAYDVKIGIPLIGLGLVLFILGLVKLIEGYRQSQES